jgi:hypothetical protein
MRERSVLSVHEVEEAIEWLLDNCEPIAEAASEREYYSKYKDSVLAMVASESDEKSQAARENEAKQDKRYLRVLERYREAVFKHELHRAQRSAKTIQIEAWRTMEANRRAAG